MQKENIKFFRNIINFVRKCDVNSSSGIRSITLNQIHNELDTAKTTEELKIAIELLANKKIDINNINLFDLYLNNPKFSKPHRSNLEDCLYILDILELIENFEEQTSQQPQVVYASKPILNSVPSC